MVFTLLSEITQSGLNQQLHIVANTRRNSPLRRDFLPNKESPSMDKMVPYKNIVFKTMKVLGAVYACCCIIVLCLFVFTTHSVCCQFNPGEQHAVTKGRVFHCSECMTILYRNIRVPGGRIFWSTLNLFLYTPCINLLFFWTKKLSQPSTGPRLQNYCFGFQKYNVSI